MDSIISTFHIDWKIIIAQAVNFGIVFAVLYVFALKPLGKFMEERGKKIEAGINNAEKSNELLQKATEEYNQNTIKLKQISVNAHNELQRDLERLRADHVAKIKADNDEWVKKRTEQMAIDKKVLVEEAKSEITSLATLMVEKLIKDKTELKDL
ncbi:hypothetical protein A3D42_00180 [Candidatus Nomurabacteria bacterium RIFCSPHIGHO2_02_FULL_41_18]|uniref:ATP synthase subunit b n=1 Tax=Candidatus Nomurabacteria bacterium RIFCSPHIGHO2_02_FULL_41_18 TaxID=1801754 RepID=A0A1F6W6Y4_9BACT|nr:MAG: hypothetical protein A2737_03055 [Candidatus Nomurabacteria bacterium RIFCSPHIGHO2_01_FULL_41_71]OGI77688.1 MAG: hypothetical protein A3D42_00180 [Candidatus Nomurabacteria bacterium RIFCSPHIGHO2_02_FULL_41_18]OGI89031.1 MAG: hypothetical protein A3B01_00430 [Candidatus Nomurabacteria bacterium RIFCSPLOWO2_01_FULL_41_52b]OGJ00372.1 MAG: hypothetical protein A3I90_00745 [Candidatus Nomurabacteria bacterium RIFCSPLOWO2_02_FULL_41_9]